MSEQKPEATEAEAKTDAEKAEDEQVLAEFEVFLLNSTMWLNSFPGKVAYMPHSKKFT